MPSSFSYFEAIQLNEPQLHALQGGYKLGWFIFNGYTTMYSVKLIIYYDIIGYMKNYMVINELKRFRIKRNQFKLLFNMHVKRKKIQIHPRVIMIGILKNVAHFRPFKSP